MKIREKTIERFSIWLKDYLTELENNPRLSPYSFFTTNEKYGRINATSNHTNSLLRLRYVSLKKGVYTSRISYKDDNFKVFCQNTIKETNKMNRNRRKGEKLIPIKKVLDTTSGDLEKQAVELKNKFSAPKTETREVSRVSIKDTVSDKIKEVVDESLGQQLADQLVKNIKLNLDVEVNIKFNIV